MVFFFVLLISVIVILIYLSLFSPEKLPWFRPHLILDKSSFEPSSVGPVRRRPVVLEGLGVPEEDPGPMQEKAERLESILAEKNKMIEKLQRQLAAEKSHRVEFEKVKALLDEEIVKLRAQNKELKGE